MLGLHYTAEMYVTLDVIQTEVIPNRIVDAYFF